MSQKIGEILFNTNNQPPTHRKLSSHSVIIFTHKIHIGLIMVTSESCHEVIIYPWNPVNANVLGLEMTTRLHIHILLFFA